MSKNNFTEKQKLDGFLELQNHIIEYEKNNKKFFIGRLSGNETTFVGKYLLKQVISPLLVNNMLYGAGIKFNNQDDVEKYVFEYNDAISKSTLLGVWDAQMYSQAEEYYNFINKVYPHIKQICAHSLEPFYFMNHKDYMYDELFKNKKILIISSHNNTIQNQLKNIDKLFPKNIFHKDVIFKIYKPPQQNAGNNDNNSWLFHCNKMKEDLQNIKAIFDFDIALVGAGGFGMIICNFLFNKLDTNVIYVGGSLQLFFGINGKRWINNKVIVDNQNNYWTSVLMEDRPINPLLCEDSCYW